MKNLFGFSSLAIIALAVSISPISRADWQGTIDIQGKSVGKEEKASGKIFASKGGMLRFEMNQQGHDAVVLTDVKKGSAQMLMPEQKMYMEMPASMKDKQMFNCSIDDVDACFKKRGFKAAGSDTVDGHPCTVWEGDEEHGGSKMHQKVWRPNDMKEVFMLKAVSKDASGNDITTHVTDIKQGKIEAALFQVPPGYKKMQMPDFSSMHH